MSTFGSVKKDVQSWLERDEADVIDTLIHYGQRRLEDDLMELDGIPPMEYGPVALTTPTNSTFTTATTGGSLSDGTYYYRVSALSDVGETLASTETSLAISAGGGAVQLVNVNWAKVDNAIGYKVYGRTTGAELLIATVGDVATYQDTGSITPVGALPTADTTITFLQDTRTIDQAEDYLSLIYFALVDETTGGRYPLSQKVWNKEFASSVAKPTSTSTGRPSVMTFNNTDDTTFNWLFNVFADKDYTIEQRYYRRLKTLVLDEDSNYWTARESKALLYATLVESIEYLGDDPRSKKWADKYEYELNNLHARWRRENINGDVGVFSSPNAFSLQGLNGRKR